MSHNASALAPYITEHTSALSTAGAGQSLVIKGFGLGLSTVVDIPSALGVETARIFTKTGATAGVLTITLTVAAIPDPMVSRSVGVSMGGVPCQGPDVTAGAISVLHGWTVSILNPALWWDADDSSTLSLSGSDVTTWTDKSSNAVAATQNTANDKPSHTARAWFSGGTAAGNVISTESGDHLLLPDLPETIDGDGQFTHFVVMSAKAYGNYKTWYQLGGGTTPTWRHYGMGGVSNGHLLKTTAGTNTQGHRTGFSDPKDVDTAYLIVFIGDAAAGYSTRLNGAEKNAPDGDTPLQMVNHNTSGWPYNGGYIGIGGCDIAEIIHVPRLCTASEIATTEAYLNAKWGVY